MIQVFSYEIILGEKFNLAFFTSERLACLEPTEAAKF